MKGWERVVFFLLVFLGLTLVGRGIRLVEVGAEAKPDEAPCVCQVRALERRLTTLERRVNEGRYRMDELEADIREIRASLQDASEERTEIMVDLGLRARPYETRGR